MKIQQHYSLLHHNTFGMDQQCDEYLEFSSTADAVAASAYIREHADRPLLILGGGSNLLLTHDFQGIVVSPEQRFEVHAEADGKGKTLLRCWAGCTFDAVVAYAVAHQMYGLENLSLIPGQCGASAVQNIGAYGAEAKDTLTSVEAVEIATGRQVTIPAEECDYAYRQSRFKHEWRDKYLITWVVYRLSSVFSPRLDYGNIRRVLEDDHIAVDTLTAQQLRDAIIRIRQAKLPDPAVLGNGGSFFMNPIVDVATFERLKAEHPDLRYFDAPDEQQGSEKHYKIPAGWLIDQCGWKGKNLGRAGVYEKQALVLVNLGGATGEDVVALMHAIQADVREKFGLELKPEVNIR